MGYFNAYAETTGTNWDCLRQAGHMVMPVVMGAPTITMGTSGYAPSSLPGESWAQHLQLPGVLYSQHLWYKAVIA